MKSTFLILVALLIGASAQAQAQSQEVAQRKQVAACSFTEPFINIDLFEDGKRKIAVFSGLIEGEAELQNEPKLDKVNNEYIGELQFLGEKTGKQTLLINLSKKGNNGMSDDIMDVEATLINDLNGKLIGGCNNIQ